MTSIHLFIIIAVLQVIDIGTTWVILRRGGFEANGFMAMFIRVYGVPVGLTLPKLCAMIFMWLNLSEHWVFRVTLLVVILHYTIVVVNNYRVLKGKRGYFE